MLRTLLGLILLALAAAAWLAWGALRRGSYRRRVVRANRAFADSREECEQQFLEMASKSGKPRGLVWKSCDFHEGFLLAHDRGTEELVALVGVTIRFEAVAGGDMEEVEAVGNLRCATALFHWQEERWTTKGRALFNLEPADVLQKYSESLDRVYANTEGDGTTQS